MTKQSKQEDLVVLITPTAIVVLRVNHQISVFMRLPAQILKRAAIPERVIQDLLEHLAKRLIPRRILLSVSEGVSHEELVVPVFDALTHYCDEATIPLIWIPDVEGLARKLLSPKPQAKSHNS